VSPGTTPMMFSSRCAWQAPTHGIREHIQAMKAFVDSTSGAPVQVKSHPIRFGSGSGHAWSASSRRQPDVTVAKWRDGEIAEEYIWM